MIGKPATAIPAGAVEEDSKVGMTRDGFLKRLRVGKPVSCVYRRDGLTGLIQAWAYGGSFALTWEECPEGEQYDESTYTRDERYKFASAEEVISFVEGAGYPPTTFTP